MIEPFAQYSSSRSPLKSFVSLQTLTDECCRDHSTEWKTLETNISDDLLSVAKNNKRREKPRGADSILGKLNFRLHCNQGCAVQLNLHGWLLFNSKNSAAPASPEAPSCSEKICIQDDD